MCTRQATETLQALFKRIMSLYCFLDPFLQQGLVLLNFRHFLICLSKPLVLVIDYSLQVRSMMLQLEEDLPNIIQSLIILVIRKGVEIGFISLLSHLVRIFDVVFVEKLDIVMQN